MNRSLTLCLLTVAGALTAGRSMAAPDALALVRDGRVMLLPADQETPVPVVAEDPGFTYALPTWAEHAQLFLVRYKTGKPAQSQLGTVEQFDALPVKPAKVDWMEGPAHLCGFGLRPGIDVLTWCTLEPGEDGNADLTATLISDKGHFGPPRHIATVMDAAGRAPRRLRISQDGKRMLLPTFPTDVSATVGLYELASKEILSPLWLDDAWMQQHHGDATVSTAAWLPDGRVVLGTLTTGLYLCNEQAKVVRGLDTWEPGKGSIHEISVSPDGQRIYYDVEDADGNRGSEIRQVTPDGAKGIVIRHASQPDVRPAAG